MSDCPSLEKLQSLLDESLTGEEWPALESHIEECAACRERLDHLTDTVVSSWLPMRAGSTFPAFECATAEVRYRFLRYHASGGLGKVLVARDERFERQVALKILSEEDHLNPDRRRRFQEEAEITAQLEHPGIVPVHALARADDKWPCYIMRFVEGETLDEAIRKYHAERRSEPGSAQGKRTLRQLLGRYVDVCNTVAYAHSRAILHRDLKPANIMLGPYGETLVLDWGLAKRFDAQQTAVAPADTEDSGKQAIPSSGAWMSVAAGTPGFMSPEQAAGHGTEIGPSADIYSLGATLYYLLTGRPVLPSSDDQTFDASSTAPVLPNGLVTPRAINPEIPLDLQAVCLRALAGRPADRYPSALALAADVERWLADEPVTARRQPLREGLRRYVKRHRVLATGVGAAALVALASLLLATGFLRAAYTRESQARQLAEQRRTLATSNLGSALQVMDHFLEKAQRNKGSKIEETVELRTYYLPPLIKFYQQLIEHQDDTDPDIRRGLGRAYHGLGVCQILMGQLTDAEASLSRARAVQEKLKGEVQDAFRRADYVADLAVTYFDLAQLHREAGHQEAAADCRLRVAELYDEFPDRKSAYKFATDVALRFEQVGQYEESPAWLGKVIDSVEALPPSEKETREMQPLLRSVLETRALIYFQLKRFHLARKDWDRRLQLDPQPLLLEVRVMRCECLVRDGDYAAAAAEAELLAARPDATSGHFLALAGTLLLSVKAVRQDGQQSSDQRARLEEQYAARAVEWLGRARDLGAFRDQKLLEEFRKDDDLAVLAGRSDFKSFMSSLEKKGQ
jgi:serine/threonine protein kinase